MLPSEKGRLVMSMYLVSMTHFLCMHVSIFKHFLFSKISITLACLNFVALEIQYVSQEVALNYAPH